MKATGTSERAKPGANPTQLRRMQLMSQTTIVKSFADLPQLLNFDELPPGPAEAPNETLLGEFVLDSAIESAEQAEPTFDLADLLAELEAASATLAAVARQDDETRALAVRDLEQYDTLAVTVRQAEHAHERAAELRRRAV